MVKPHGLFGLSGAGPLFTQEVIEAMCQSTERPLIFPLSNPTSKAEVSAENAYKWSDGKCIFAAGSPFEPVTYNGKTYIPGQGNNVFIFPGVGFGAWAVGASEIPDEFLLEAAKELANCVSNEELVAGQIYPSIANLRTVSRNVAVRTAQCAYKMGLARRPHPPDLHEFIESAMYSPCYSATLSTPDSAKPASLDRKTVEALHDHQDSCYKDMQWLLVPSLGRAPHSLWTSGVICISMVSSLLWSKQ